MADKTIAIVGGGLAGLVTALDLTRRGVACELFEKRQYPFHRVCGEYISNEVVPYLRSLGAYPEALHPSHLDEFQLTAINGRSAILPLTTGGFGISRYKFDAFLYQLAKQQGVTFHTDTEVEKIEFADKANQFIIQAGGKSFTADVVVGSYGKRTKLDILLQRSFMRRRSPYLGVKYHIRLGDFPLHRIALHNFEGGYCGISRIEGELLNLCYLSHRDNLRSHGNIAQMEQAILFNNPFLKDIFERAEFVLKNPETINEISFETKEPVCQHVLMAGDAAGMITPLCGNGMAMAIHASSILSKYVHRYCRDPHYNRMRMETDYEKNWKSIFAWRLWTGRQIQRLFGGVNTSNLAVNLARHAGPIANFLVNSTHGKPF